MPLSVYIQPYLWGWAELKAHINPITVEFRSFSITFPLPPPFPFPPISPSNTRDNRKRAPPLFWGLWAQVQYLSSLRNAHPVASAPPLSKGCERLKCTWRRDKGGSYMRGDLGYGMPIQCIMKTNHDEHCGSFSSFLHAFHPTNSPST